MGWSITSNAADKSNIIRTTAEQLDCEIQLSEVLKSVRALKLNKSPGIDLLTAEMFVNASNLLSPILCKLFNYIYDSGCYPQNWSNGITVPVPKKGDKNDVNNYRGIMLTSIFPKLFSQILDSRLRHCAEENNLLSDDKFVFR